MKENINILQEKPDEPALKACGQLIQSRRTINIFKDKPVPDSLLAEAIDVARWAPNHKLTEPWHFHIAGEETKRKLVDLVVAIKVPEQDEKVSAAMVKKMGAIPNWFLVTYSKSDDPVRQLEDYAACCCVVQNLMLYLWQAGVGVKWNTGRVIRDERMYELLDIDPDRSTIVGLFWCGYPDRVPEQKRKPVDEICTWLD